MNSVISIIVILFVLYFVGTSAKSWLVRLIVMFISFIFLTNLMAVAAQSGSIQVIFPIAVAFAGFLILKWGSFSSRALFLVALFLGIKGYSFLGNNTNLACGQINTFGQPYVEICNDNTILDAFNSNSDKYHCYTIRTQICNQLLNPNCTKENIYNIMKSNVSFQAPTDDVSPVNDCGTFYLNDVPWWYNILSNNPIKVKLNDSNFSATNYTLPNHMFHPGKVRRQIIVENNEIFIETNGEGTGQLKPVNNSNFLMKRVWGPVDARLKKQLN